MTSRNRQTAILVRDRTIQVEVAIVIALLRAGSATRVQPRGIFDAEVLTAFREALLAVGIGEDEIGDLSQQGPRDLARYLPYGKDQAGLDGDIAQAFAAAWAWWAIKQGPPIPRQAYHVLAEYNRQLAASGMPSITPDVVPLFADVPAPTSGGGRSGVLLLIVGAAVVLAVGVAVLGWKKKPVERMLGA